MGEEEGMEMTNKEYSNLILEYFNGEKAEVDANKPLEVYAALTAELCRRELSKESALEWIKEIGEREQWHEEPGVRCWAGPEGEIEE